MTFLRSPAGHGLDPNLTRLRRQGAESGKFTPPYHRPATDLFDDHIRSWIAAYCRGIPVMQATAQWVARDGTGYRIHTDIGEVTARFVVLSPGPPPPRVPDEFSRHLRHGSVVHIHDAIPPVPSGAGIAIVGGGIAAAHRALAWSMTHHVDLWLRDTMSVWQFDSAPCFIGPRCGERFRSVASPELRRQLISRSRRPGSLPPDLHQTLESSIQAGRIREIHAAVRDVVPAGRSLYLAGTDFGGRPRQGLYELVVLATGFADGPPAPELVRHSARNLASPLAADGFPVPNAQLEWAPGLFLSGGLAELELGPPARNIIGAHLASRRIVPALAIYRGRSSLQLSRARPAHGRVSGPQAERV